MEIITVLGDVTTRIDLNKHLTVIRITIEWVIKVNLSGFEISQRYLSLDIRIDVRNFILQ